MRHWLLVADLVHRAFPEVDRRLAGYLELARALGTASGDTAQALLSIPTKRFHSHGAAAFACLTPGRQPLLDAIVALQTMSDYLDNLCDRAHPGAAVGFRPDPGAEEARFRRLHAAVGAAVDLPPRSGERGTRAAPPAAQDPLLATLVADCRRGLDALPSYQAVEPEIRRLVDLYCDVQSYKHLPPGRREAALANWHAGWSRSPEPVGRAARHLPWHEFAAACGSTLGVFALFRLAASPGVRPQQAQALAKGYFPYICGLHIMLDYLIDMEEDRASQDLNFAAAYGARERIQEGLIHLLRCTLQAAATLPDAWFHQLVVRGLLALYLSDPKVQTPHLRQVAFALMREGGSPTGTLWHLCRLLRRRGVISPSWQPTTTPPSRQPASAPAGPVRPVPAPGKTSRGVAPCRSGT